MQKFLDINGEEISIGDKIIFKPVRYSEKYDDQAFDVGTIEKIGKLTIRIKKEDGMMAFLPIDKLQMIGSPSNIIDCLKTK